MWRGAAVPRFVSRRARPCTALHRPSPSFAGVVALCVRTVTATSHDKFARFAVHAAIPILVADRTTGVVRRFTLEPPARPLATVIGLFSAAGPDRPGRALERVGRARSPAHGQRRAAPGERQLPRRDRRADRTDRRAAGRDRRSSARSGSSIRRRARPCRSCPPWCATRPRAAPRPAQTPGPSSRRPCARPRTPSACSAARSARSSAT